MVCLASSIRSQGTLIRYDYYDLAKQSFFYNFNILRLETDL